MPGPYAVKPVKFWDARKPDGFNTVWPGALRSVYQNAIDYR